MTDKTAVDLLPCPFCGCKAMWNNSSVIFSIQCSQDEMAEGKTCPVLPSSGDFKKEQDAIEAWNTRAYLSEKRSEPTGDKAAANNALKRLLDAKTVDEQRPYYKILYDFIDSAALQDNTAPGTSNPANI